MDAKSKLPSNSLFSPGLNLWNNWIGLLVCKYTNWIFSVSIKKNHTSILNFLSRKITSRLIHSFNFSTHYKISTVKKVTIRLPSDVSMSLSSYLSRNMKVNKTAQTWFATFHSSIYFFNHRFFVFFTGRIVHQICIWNICLYILTQCFCLHYPFLPAFSRNSGTTKHITFSKEVN